MRYAAAELVSGGGGGRRDAARELVSKDETRGATQQRNWFHKIEAKKKATPKGRPKVVAVSDQFLR